MFCAACVHGIGCAVSRLQRCDAGKTVERTHTAECLKAGTGRHIHGLDEAACREGKHIGVRPNVGSQQGGVVGIAAGNRIVFPGAFEGDLQPGPVERNGSPDITGIGLDGRSGPGLCGAERDRQGRHIPSCPGDGADGREDTQRAVLIRQKGDGIAVSGGRDCHGAQLQQIGCPAADRGIGPGILAVECLRGRTADGCGIVVHGDAEAPQHMRGIKLDAVGTVEVVDVVVRGPLGVFDDDGQRNDAVRPDPLPANAAQLGGCALLDSRLHAADDAGQVPMDLRIQLLSRRRIQQQAGQMQGIAPFGAPGVGERAFVRVSLAEHAVVERRRGLLRRRGRCRRGGRLGGNGRLTARGDRQ